uniref:metallophosphoesterase n=1 Tax=uncultured Tenacibaculum sp. TaxID=174713 RepID=UPI0026368A54|nr:metallophosphoesterase [uncultured Tenacibaculum sp.]
MFSSNNRLNRAFKKAKKLPLNEASKYVLFSDCHRGDNSFADDFARNRKIYHFALSQYLQKDFTYIELGDGDELWENKFVNIFNANKDVYLLLQKFHLKNKLHFIWGNHDMNYRKPKNVRKNLSYYYDTIDGKEKELLPNASFSEAIRLTQDDGKSIFLLHGHQADWFNYTFWKLSRFLVKVLWRPLQIHGIKDPTSPAQNFKELIKVERRLENWVKANNNQMIVTGHTHRPRFPSCEELPHFNDGSCVHPRCITGLEIENNEITLIKWHLVTNNNGTMQITRTVLEGPEKIAEYL